MPAASRGYACAQYWAVSSTLLLSLSCLVHGTEVDDIIGSLGWHEPHINAGDEVFGEKEAVSLPSCNGITVAVLNLGSFAHSKDLHPCSQELMGDHAELIKSPYSGPLHLVEAIKSSQYYTSDIEEADVVLVDDFCYYVTGEAFKLESVATEDGTNKTLRGAAMVAAYDELVKSSRWQRHLGADFVFYDSHAGFGINNTGIPLDDFLCSDFRNATLLTTDRALRVEMCRSQNLEPLPHGRVMVVPIVPHRLDPNRPDMHLKRAPLPLAKRSILVNKRSLCPDDVPVPLGFNEWGSSFSFEGNIMLNLLEPVMADAEDQVDCNRYEYLSVPRDPRLGGGKTIRFERTYSALEESVFCVFLPGATGMGYRLSEALMAGCIPVFVGPPYPPLPFLDELRYAAAAVFLNITDHSAWERDATTSKIFAEFAKENPTLSASYSSNPNELLEPAIAGRTLEVPNMQAVLETLKGLPEEEVMRRLVQIAEIRHRFAFDTEITAIPSAPNVMLSGICKRSGRGCSKSRLRREAKDSAHRERCRVAAAVSAE